jgi:hypothetical protein
MASPESEPVFAATLPRPAADMSVAHRIRLDHASPSAGSRPSTRGTRRNVRRVERNRRESHEQASYRGRESGAGAANMPPPHRIRHGHAGPCARLALAPSWPRPNRLRVERDGRESHAGTAYRPGFCGPRSSGYDPMPTCHPATRSLRRGQTAANRGRWIWLAARISVRSWSAISQRPTSGLARSARSATSRSPLRAAAIASSS